MASRFREARPDWDELPAELERAWTWLEEQGFGVETPSGALLLLTDDEASSIAFDPSLSLDGWLRPEDAGHAALLPIAQAAGDGSLVALWKDGGAVRVVLLGSDGERGVIADDIREFLTLLAVGYDELLGFNLGAEPEEPVDVSAFRAWVTAELGVEVPESWPGIADDEFGTWLAGRLGEETPEPDAAEDSPGAARLSGDARRLLGLLGQPDDAGLTARMGEILGIELGATLRASARALRCVGIEVHSTRAGLETIWLRAEDHPRPDELVAGLGATSTAEDAIALLGEPEKSGSGWVRYVVDGRYLHLDFSSGGILATMMVDAP